MVSTVIIYFKITNSTKNQCYFANAARCNMSQSWCFPLSILIALKVWYFPLSLNVAATWNSIRSHSSVIGTNSSGFASESPGTASSYGWQLGGNLEWMTNIDTTTCLLYQHMAETLRHLFFDGPFFRSIWCKSVNYAVLLSLGIHGKMRSPELLDSSVDFFP